MPMSYDTAMLSKSVICLRLREAALLCLLSFSYSDCFADLGYKTTKTMAATTMARGNHGLRKTPTRERY